MMNRKGKDKCALLRSLELIVSDSKLTAWHVALLAAIYLTSAAQNSRHHLKVSRKRLMALSHISTIPTYHKYLKELQDMGYIAYRPSYHPDGKSEIDLKQP